MIVYGSSLSPFVRKVIAFASEKGIELELKPVQPKSSAGSWFHCLQATSQALQPMHSVVSVRKPTAPGRAPVED